MTDARPLQVSAVELLRQPGVRKPVQRVVHVADLVTSVAAVAPDADIDLDLVVESNAGRLVVEGTVRAPWTGECRRCLGLVEGVLDVEVREVFERNPTDGETYPLLDDRIELGALIREAILPSLPLAPLCRPDCAGPAPEVFPTSVEDEAPAGTDDDATDADAPRDPRWAALDDLHFD